MKQANIIFAVRNASFWLKAGCLLSSVLFSTYPVFAGEIKVQPESRFAKQTSKFKELSSIAKIGRLSSLGFSIDCAEKQSLKDGGLKLRVSIKNNGTENLALINPLEFFNVVLIDESGRIVSLRPPVFTGDRRLKIRTEEKEREFPFTLDSVSINDRLLSKAEINARQLDLAPSANLVIDLTFSKIYQKQDAEEAVVSIPAGRYRVRLLTTISDAASIKVRRTIKSAEIPIQLTQ